MPEAKKEQVLSVRDLDITFKTTAGPVHAIRGVNIDLYKGETVALVGESGSGKSVTMKAAMGILAKNATVNSGSIRFSYHHADGSPETVDLLQKDKKWIRRHINGKRIAMVFQDPMASLNPRKKVEDIIGEGLDIHHLCKTQAERREKVEKILAKVGLAPEHAERYPHQFSGGQRQRVGIARALIMNPKLIIADECISALDVSIQAQVVNLMKDIQQETGTTEEIFEHPIHPYTRSLLSAIPLPNPVVEKRRVAETYDYATSGIDYSKGTSHHVEGSHYVKCTDEEFAKWCK